MKRYMNASLLYALLAMVGGVFYREFTKFNGFTARTSLGGVVSLKGGNSFLVQKKHSDYENPNACGRM